MKKLLMVFCVLVFGSIACVSTASVGGSSGLKPALGDNGKWGYTDSQGKFVIRPIFESAGEFNNGIAVIRVRGGKYGFIDQNGKLFFYRAMFDNARNFCEGLAAVMIDFGSASKWGYIDLTGKFIIPPQFEEAGDFRDGKAPVKKDGKRGYIDKQGTVISGM